MTQPPYDPSGQDPSGPDPSRQNPFGSGNDPFAKPTPPNDAPPPNQPPAGGFPPPGGGFPPPGGGFPPPGGGFPPQQPPNYPPPGGFQPPPTAPGYPAAPSPAAGYGYGAPGGGMPVPTGMQYDPASGLTMPVGTELATPGRRIGGFFLEIVLAIVTLVIGYIIWTLIVWARGQTPAKQVLNMRIYRVQDQRPANWGYMALRQVVGGFVNGIFYIGWIVSFIFLFSDAQRRTVPDRIAGTVELYDPNGVFSN